MQSRTLLRALDVFPLVTSVYFTAFGTTVLYLRLMASLLDEPLKSLTEILRLEVKSMGHVFGSNEKALDIPPAWRESTFRTKIYLSE